jgi:hypothetical protein
MVVEVVGKDQAVMSEVVAWTQQQWRQRDIKAHVEEERGRGVNPTVVGEAVDDLPAWTQRWSGRWLARPR